MNVIEIGLKEVIILFVFLLVCRLVYVKIMNYLDRDKFLSKLPVLNKNLLRYGIQIQEQEKYFVFLGWNRTTGPMTISQAKMFMSAMGRNEQTVVDYFKESSSQITKSVDFFEETK
ncbi:hypothetical protein AsFcp4_278 [Aeromonas phage AsFcp_4]|uniref:Uncharacterized protein n=1 Tax=Aeromonas phage PX29 TaxID=926067 RepID=E5DQ54_9CAUD|nr:hypothetical protein CL89_gp121 [Aeromonas phage PX29]ADQ52840.1 conserved hypothetical protein [Aeromonas phage PX29]QAX99729.1 hypothetical protein AsFcp4_278 [Aeromonas phage AsFcp_4]